MKPRNSVVSALCLGVFVALSPACADLSDGGGSRSGGSSSSDRGGRAGGGGDDAGVSDNTGSSDTNGSDSEERLQDIGDRSDMAPSGDAGFSVADVPAAGALRGTVWAPGNAPGMVPAGQEIPVPGALIYLDYVRALAIPDGAYCEYCEDLTPRAVFSDHRGNFEVPEYVPGDYWLTIQKGQFRLELEVTIYAGAIIDLPTEVTTLPSVHDPEHGRWVPSIAIAVGNYDKLEDILGKMGLGAVDGNGQYIPNSAAGHIDVYENGGYGFDSVSSGTLEYLVSDLERMLQYHIIFIPCAADMNTSALRNQNVLRNIRDYVAAGGKLYVTDWSGEWSDNVFPASIELEGSSNDTPASAFNPATDSWNTSAFGDADGSSYDSNNAEVVNDMMFAWLDGQQGPTAFNASTSTYDASHFDVEGNWNTILRLNTLEIGIDDDGEPILDTPIAYVVGGHGSSEPKRPLTVTFEPAGCGRVLYSTYHTTDDTHVGLVPQERVLLHLIMDIGVCRDVKF